MESTQDLEIRRALPNTPRQLILSFFWTRNCAGASLQLLRGIASEWSRAREARPDVRLLPLEESKIHHQVSQLPINSVSVLLTPHRMGLCIYKPTNLCSTLIDFMQIRQNMYKDKKTIGTEKCRYLDSV